MPDDRPQEPPHSLLLYTHAVYALYAAGFILYPLWVIGIMIAYLKRDSAQGTMLASHFQWQIQTFPWGLIGLGILLVAMVGLQYLVAYPLFTTFAYGLTGLLYGFGIAWLIWLCYRVARGWALLNMQRPAPTI